MLTTPRDQDAKQNQTEEAKSHATLLADAKKKLPALCRVIRKKADTEAPEVQELVAIVRLYCRMKFYRANIKDATVIRTIASDTVRSALRDAFAGKFPPRSAKRCFNKITGFASNAFKKLKRFNECQQKNLGAVSDPDGQLSTTAASASEPNAHSRELREILEYLRTLGADANLLAACEQLAQGQPAEYVARVYAHCSRATFYRKLKSFREPLTPFLSRE